MADPVTPNIGLSVPIRGTDVGTWDLPVNGDFTLLDSMLGGVTTLNLSATPVTLAASQAQNSIIRLTGTMLSNIPITLPSIYKSWTIDNQLLNHPSSFTAILLSTSGANQIGLPPSVQDVFYDGVSPKYRNLGQVGEYWDYAAITVPAWVVVSTIPPYLLCDGTTFSSATYPVLANLLGGNTRPDARGRARFTINSGMGRITTTGGLDGNTLFAGGGFQTVTIGTSNLPPYTPAGTVATSITGNTFTVTPGSGNLQYGGTGIGGTVASPAPVSSFSGVAQGGVSAPLGSINPGYVGGITMIRAA
jgi:hypothetical protein